MTFYNNQQILYILMDGNEPVAVYTDKTQAESDCWDCNKVMGYTDESNQYPDFWVSSAPLSTDKFPTRLPAEL